RTDAEKSGKLAVFVFIDERRQIFVRDGPGEEELVEVRFERRRRRMLARAEELTAQRDDRGDVRAPKRANAPRPRVTRGNRLVYDCRTHLRVGIPVVGPGARIGKNQAGLTRNPAWARHLPCYVSHGITPCCR